MANNKAYLKAERKIQEAWRVGKTSLDLSLVYPLR